MNSFAYVTNYIKYGFIVIAFSLFFLGGFSNAGDNGDLLKNAFYRAHNDNVVVEIGENVKSVGNTVFKESTVVGKGKKPSLIVKITEILLSLVIALSVTMILYNGMMYIIETGQGKESKDLTKNIAYIVIGILVALFSVVIIRLVQSIPNTLNSELIQGNNGEIDNDTINRKG